MAQVTVDIAARPDDDMIEVPGFGLIQNHTSKEVSPEQILNWENHAGQWKFPESGELKVGDNATVLKQAEPDETDTDLTQQGTAEAVIDGQQVTDTPPEGTAAEILEWVADDPTRAQAALDAENERDNPRSTLIDSLEKVVS
jgi:hypothetical protein